MCKEMTKKELKEMIQYFSAMVNNHQRAGRMEAAYEYGSKRAACERELMSRATK